MKNNQITLILKIFGFAILAIAGYIDLLSSKNRFFQDPFYIGATVMVIASILTLINPTRYYIHTAMFFFIFTKIISQYTHSNHFNFLGKKIHHS
jgi:hypothetical protein